MHPVLDQLHKVLKLEIQNNYPNKAVIGGLPKMLVFWEPNARRAGLDPAFIEAVAGRLQSYPDLPDAERPAAIQAMLKMVKDASAQPGAGPAAPRAASAPHPAATPPQPAPSVSSQVSAPPAEAAPAVPDAPPPQGPTPTMQAASALPAAAPAPVPPPRKNAPPGARREKVQKAPKSQSAAQRPRMHESVYQSEEPLDPRPRRPVGPRPLKAPVPVDSSVGLDAPLTVLFGVGPETAKAYERLGINHLRDLLLHFPRRYDNYSKMKTINRLEYGEDCSVIATVWEAHVRRFRGQQTMLKVALSDTTGMLEVTFFNQPYLAHKLTPGRQIVISGRISQYLGRLTIQPEEWEDLDRELLNTGRIVPVYPATADLKQRHMRKLTSQLIQYWAPRVPDPLPAEVVERAGLMKYGEALAQIHFPDSEASLEAARHRLAFDELLLLQLGALRQRSEWQAAEATPRSVPDDWFQGALDRLPYRLTDAQQRALADIRADLARPVPMNRLLQGDVGSGKTAVAAMAMAATARAGAQGALMAPTSILAEQHFRTLTGVLGPALDVPPEAIRLLQGSTSASEKDEIYAGLVSGAIKMVVGTHALIEAPVEFADLGLAVVDEQHRFGVAQRAALRGKGHHPHLLVMTATPIPRSLALTVYGDLDLSVLDEMPPGRQPIQTHVLRPGEQERGYAFIRSQLEKGKQAFVIFPLVEESEKIEAKAAVEEHQRLETHVFPDYRVGLLHGRMRPEEKDEVMQRFRAGHYHVLVSTSVVEVGVDVPNATVILIEGANRFGLAQLHQFRGRVGRGAERSYCLLVADGSPAAARAHERLMVMEQSQDGFYLAERDLDLRGPGEFLGTRQSGYSGLRMARLTDLPTIEKARREARLIFEKDPDLKSPEHHLLAEKMVEFWTLGAGDVS